MKMFSVQNAKSLFLFEMFCQTKHKFAKTWVSYKLDFSIHLLQLVKILNPVLIYTDASKCVRVRGVRPHLPICSFQTLLWSVQFQYNHTEFEISTDLLWDEPTRHISKSDGVCERVCARTRAFGGFLWGHGLWFHPVLRKPFSFNRIFVHW